MVATASVDPHSPLSCPETQQVSPLDEGLWNELMTPRWVYWRRRSADLDLTPSQRRYADARARRLDSPYTKRLDGCARSGVNVKCGCKGRRDTRWFTCRQHLVCERCQHERARRLGVRIRKGLEAAAAANPHLMVVLITISVRHTGDIAADRKALARGWRRFYKAYHRRWGAFPYVGTHEITPGRDKLGHPHAHIVALWPHRRWGPNAPGPRDEDDLATLWRAACPESTRINFEASRSVKGAARYVSKYISKGVQGAEFAPELRTRVVCGTYGTRWLMSSVGFWVPFVPCCPDCQQPIVRVILRDPWRRDAFPVDWCPDGTADPDAGCQLAIQSLS